MKLVREHINEKFTEKSDPVEDLGIGGYSWSTLSRGAIIRLKPDLRSVVALTKNQSGQFTSWHSGMKIFKESALVVTGVAEFSDDYKDIHIKKFPSETQAREFRESWMKSSGRSLGWGGMNNRMIVSKLQFERRFDVIERGFDGIKESLYEKFTEKSDPVKDMGIGDYAIADLCDQFFNALIHKKRAEPANFPWNCYFLIKDGNEIGFFYKYGDYIHIYSYLENPDMIIEIGNYREYLKRKGFELKRIPKDMLAKTETFKQNSRNLNYQEKEHPAIE